MFAYKIKARQCTIWCDLLAIPLMINPRRFKLPQLTEARFTLFCGCAFHSENIGLQTHKSA